jgi:hypothetical protein
MMKSNQHSAKPPFIELLFEMMKSKNLTGPEVYKAAGMDRRLFSKITNFNQPHIPSKPNVVALVLALRCDPKESKELIKRAGYILTHGIAFDRVILQCIDDRIYDLNRVNERLNDANCPVINVLE